MRLKGCRISICTSKRDTMHRHNKLVPGILCIILFASAIPCWTQASQGSSQANPPGQQTVQPTPLPSDVDANDLALPVWMRPASSTLGQGNPAGTNPAPNTTGANAANGNPPPGDNQSGRVGQ